MFAGYDGALAEAQRACSALRADDALRRKIEPELRKIPPKLRKIEAGREDAHTHTHTACVCVCVCVCEDERILI